MNYEFWCDLLLKQKLQLKKTEEIYSKPYKNHPLQVYAEFQVTNFSKTHQAHYWEFRISVIFSSKSEKIAHYMGSYITLIYSLNIFVFGIKSKISNTKKINRGTTNIINNEDIVTAQIQGLSWNVIYNEIKIL